MVLIIDSSWCMRRGQSRSGLVEKDEEKGSGGKEGGTREHRDAMMSGDQEASYHYESWAGQGP